MYSPVHGLGCWKKIAAQAQSTEAGAPAPGLDRLVFACEVSALQISGDGAVLLESHARHLRCLRCDPQRPPRQA